MVEYTDPTTGEILMGTKEDAAIAAAAEKAARLKGLAPEEKGGKVISLPAPAAPVTPAAAVEIAKPFFPFTPRFLNLGAVKADPFNNFNIPHIQAHDGKATPLSTLNGKEQPLYSDLVTPAIFIREIVSKEIDYIVQVTAEKGIEVGGFLLMTQLNPRFPQYVVYDHFLPIQKGTSGDLEIDGPDTQRYMKFLKEKHPQALLFPLGHWHSHHNMGAFWSATDKTQQTSTTQLAFQTPYRFFLVRNAKRQQQASFIQYSPFFHRVDDVWLGTYDPKDDTKEFLTEERKAELDAILEAVMEKSALGNYNGYYNYNGYRAGGKTWREEQEEREKEAAAKRAAANPQTAAGAKEVAGSLPPLKTTCSDGTKNAGASRTSSTTRSASNHQDLIAEMIVVGAPRAADAAMGQLLSDTLWKSVRDIKVDNIHLERTRKILKEAFGLTMPNNILQQLASFMSRYLAEHKGNDPLLVYRAVDNLKWLSQLTQLSLYDRDGIATGLLELWEKHKGVDVGHINLMSCLVECILDDLPGMEVLDQYPVKALYGILLTPISDDLALDYLALMQDVISVCVPKGDLKKLQVDDLFSQNYHITVGSRETSRDVITTAEEAFQAAIMTSEDERAFLAHDVDVVEEAMDRSLAKEDRAGAKGPGEVTTSEDHVELFISVGDSIPIPMDIYGTGATSLECFDTNMQDEETRSKIITFHELNRCTAYSAYLRLLASGDIKVDSYGFVEFKFPSGNFTA